MKDAEEPRPAASPHTMVLDPTGDAIGVDCFCAIGADHDEHQEVPD